MPTVDLADGTILIHSEQSDRDKIRQVPGARWDRESALWLAPLSWTTCKMLRAVFGDRLTITEALSKWAWNEYQERILPSMKVREMALDPEAWGGERYGFQPPASEFLATARQAILADEMGTGKTKQTIDALELLGDKAYPALVVCPASVKRNWRREFERFAPGRRVAVLEGPAKKRREILAGEWDVLVMNFDLLRHHSKLAPFGSVALRRCAECGGDREAGVSERACEAHEKELNALAFRSIVADEAHRLKDARAKQTRALKAAAGDAEYRFALTGTPIANRPDELWSLLHFIAPAEWPSKTRYVDRYCAQAWNGFGHEILGLLPAAKDEFYEILDPRFLRRPKALVLPFLPEKVYETRYVEMGDAQRRAYVDMEDRYVAAVEGGTISATTPLAQATRLRQFASSLCEIVGTNEVSMSAPSCKVDALLDLLADMDDEQVVVFADHRQLIDLAELALRDRGVSYGRITGAESERERDEYLQAFRDGKLRVMLATLGAGGTGIDGLQVARVAVFMERSWSLVLNRQAEDRLHRIGQTADSVTIVDLVAAGTIEEYVADKLAEKGALLEEIVRDHETLARLIRTRGE